MKSRKAPLRLKFAAWRYLVLMATLGCGAGQEPLGDRVLRCAQLQGALESSNEALAAEVSRIVAQGEGPEQLSRPAKPAEQNAAAVLAEAYTDADRLRVFADLEQRVAPHGGPAGAAHVAAMRTLLEREQTLLEAANQGVRRPTCASGARFDLGFFERYYFLDDAAIAARMLMLSAYVALDDGDRPKAVSDATNAGRWVHWLSQEPRLEGRLLGARLRLEWFGVVQSLLGDSPSRQELAGLFATVREMLDTWPPERRAWVGDRALTLHAYEAIRAGMIDRILTREEEERLEEAGRLEPIQQLSGPALDEDQQVYVEAMEQIIRGLNQPYHQRVEPLEELFERVGESGVEARRAPLACGLFLVGLPQSLERTARDRAVAEAWLLTIASAGKFDLPPYRVSPLTGRPYEADRDARGVHLKLHDAEVADPFVHAPRDASSS